ncbi:mannose-1-phosphate guanylyltransferase/mannose-6-phosphate isomerase [Acinetobacter sp. SFB]|uniref:mannose-1-phosphate guanylyltransferase/mannose-6-phosphate isomerase n=1 Tax=Acinetobacter sp. SFB TaxID=1805634 RepID=UPI0007D77425|nr:mannose-1-phosphate guanylyltransferase/mannose-6-phosphate isomerase [Acinetobacter sp. SFB]OAL77854.1 mannose-1-phosphate guanylyltransferase/mannose-6-phosphate isomerase [Acinetobacter sp. SFB]
MKIVPIIMAGGFGTRLWPQSRVMHPKQFLAFNGAEETLLQATLKRLDGLDVEPPIVVCNEEHRFLIAEQLRAIKIENAYILLEKKSRNTAPAITLAAILAERLYEDSILIVFAADHYFSDKQELQASVKCACALAKSGNLITFGIKPDKPETGYGYIKLGVAIASENIFKVEGFIEKPNLMTAKEYLEAGEYLWNSGNFVFTSSTFLKTMKEYANEIYESCIKAMNMISTDLSFVRADEKQLECCPALSIDYAVMEKADNLAVIAISSSWKDLGSWGALAELADKDNNGNTLIGDVFAIDSNNNYLVSNHRVIAAIGVNDIAVIETQDAILVVDKTKTQEVKQIVEYLQKTHRKEASEHPKTYRPWGSYECVDKGDRYQVKRITVKPGAKLSTQLHHHRAEHWVVVCGTAKVTRGNEVFILAENQSTFIPIGEVHTLENPGKIPLELIEVQSGAYLGEDDIIRLKDEYGRI